MKTNSDKSKQAPGTCFDIETDGLNATKMHVIAYEELGDIAHGADVDHVQQLFSDASILVGHNIQTFDLPTLNKLFGLSYKGKVIDTLALSWVLFPAKNRHGLEQWGESLGIAKPEVTDWESLSYEEYAHRCTEDVKITRALWNLCWNYLMDIYEGRQKAALEFCYYTAWKLGCVADQEVLGIKLDVEGVRRDLATLEREEELRLDQLKRAMPPLKRTKVYNRPRNLYSKTKKGQLNKTGALWMELSEMYGFNPELPHAEVHFYDELPNPGSPQQLKNWLDSLGWEPCSFKYKRDKDTGKFDKTPQINGQGPDDEGISESVRRLIRKEPAVEALDGLFVVRHRKTVLQGFLDNMDDKGYIKAGCGGLTNTLRLQHRVVANLPAVSKAYGEMARGALICEAGEILVGSDMSALEDKIKQHLIWDYDNLYVQAMQAPGYDPHIAVSITANLMTEEEAEYFKANKKNGNDKEVKRLAAIRQQAKTVNYSSVYGVGAAKLALTLGTTQAKAKKLLDAYWELNWAVKAVSEDFDVREVGGQKFIRNPISGFWHTLRADKDRFSTVVQSSGVYCFDLWIKEMKSKGLPIILQYHDEVLVKVKEKNAERAKGVILSAMDTVNSKLKLNVKLGCEVQTGFKYSDIH